MLLQGLWAAYNAFGQMLRGMLRDVLRDTFFLFPGGSKTYVEMLRKA